MTVPKRTCELCGAEYSATDTALRCTATESGTYCGGEILPPPSAERPPAACLVCMDTGTVEIQVPGKDARELRPCPRGHN